MGEKDWNTDEGRHRKRVESRMILLPGAQVYILSASNSPPEREQWPISIKKYTYSLQYCINISYTTDTLKKFMTQTTVYSCTSEAYRSVGRQCIYYVSDAFFFYWKCICLHLWILKFSLCLFYYCSKDCNQVIFWKRILTNMRAQADTQQSTEHIVS